MKIAIVGAAGRMGRMLVKLAGEDKNLDVVAEIDVADGYAREWPACTAISPCGRSPMMPLRP